MKKTNAMRILDNLGLDYNMLSYDDRDGKVDGISVANKLNRPVEEVYKTLVAQGSKSIYVFLLPVAEELDLKKAAKSVGEKKIELIAVKDLKKYTGYIRGGCSPIGMSKNYKTIIDDSVIKLDSFIVSGGKIGVQIELSFEVLEKTIDIEIANIRK